ncbi:oxygen-dependent choline dehydrogenase-like [Brevipalpus obovatus]|uniref:oxygen-dependent choline dehydrogenase-like n=1 Tax=Brevipalpus obovatus TaxID=246614 RepID=UPI003D9E11D8
MVSANCVKTIQRFSKMIAFFIIFCGLYASFFGVANTQNASTTLTEGIFSQKELKLGDIKNGNMFIDIIKDEVSKVPNWGPRVYDLILRLMNVLTTPGYPLKLKDIADQEYDYIVVGAGSAGSVVAARLSEVKENRVLLLEAGGEESKFSLTPFVANLLHKSELAYEYRNQREKLCGWGKKDNRIGLPIGRGIGGSSAIYNLIYVRGDPLDYNRWEQLGATGWSWPDVFPYFLKLERVTDKGASVFDEGYHGTDGPIAVQGNLNPSIIAQILIESVKSLNLPFGDLNGRNMSRFSFNQQNVEGGQRVSTGRAYLSPASSRKNLDIVINAVVQRVLIDTENKLADGVEYEKNGKLYRVKARKEVIISAGSYNSPKLLMLSGIGPKDELKKHGIPIVVDLPGVGQNLQDHASPHLFYTTKYNTSNVYIRTEPLINSAKMYADDRSGSFGAAGAQIKAFYRSKYALDERPDIGFTFSGSLTSSVYSNMVNEYINGFKSIVTKRYFLPQAYRDGFSILFANYRPLSRGYVRLASKRVEDEPIIHHNYYTDERDLKVMVEAAKLGARIAESRVAREGLDTKPFPNTLPQCEKYPQGSDDFFRCVAQTTTATGFHPVGTCKMGAIDDLTAVVDPQLRVRGIRNLRVIDASIMPEITSGNTNAPTIMIGEKGSDIIRGRKLEQLLPPVKNPKSALKYQDLQAII